MQSHEYEKMFHAEDRYFWFVGKHCLIQALLGEALADIPDPLILDVGCGTGGVLKHLEGLGMAVGIDCDLRALSLCKRRGSERLMCMKWEEPALKPETYDAVVASDFIEHLDNDVEALIRMRQALKPGGKLLVTVPAMPWLWGPHDIALGHKRRYTRRALVRALVDAGFIPQRVFPFMCLLMPFLVPVRLILKLYYAAFGEGHRGGPYGSPEFQTRPYNQRSHCDTISYDVPDALNRFFLSLLDVERLWAMRGHDFTFGSTLVALATREMVSK